MNACDKSADAIRKFGYLSGRTIAGDAVHEGGSECITRADGIGDIDAMPVRFDVFSSCQHGATTSTQRDTHSVPAEMFDAGTTESFFVSGQVCEFLYRSQFFFIEL